MKNQAVTTILTVLLAVSLSAIAALALSSKVAGEPTTADTPAAINIAVPADAPGSTAPIATDKAGETTADTPITSTSATAAPSNDAPSNADVSDADVSDADPIPCLLGYDYIDGECTYLGCPTDYMLFDGECVPDFSIDPGVVIPICPQGQHWQNGACVPDFSIDPGLLIPRLELIAGV
jgi:hypothetical protein